MIICRNECFIVVGCDLRCHERVYYGNLTEVEGSSLVAFSFIGYLNQDVFNICTHVSNFRAVDIPPIGCGHDRFHTLVRYLPHIKTTLCADWFAFLINETQSSISNNPLHIHMKQELFFLNVTPYALVDRNKCIRDIFYFIIQSFYEGYVNPHFFLFISPGLVHYLSSNPMVYYFSTKMEVIDSSKKSVFNSLPYCKLHGIL